MQLNDQQADAMTKIVDWYKDPFTPFRLFGYAGTGKTTLAARVAKALGVTPVFGTYTGKAASVLQRKGVDGQTIHSSIYRPVGTAETLRKLERAQEELELAKASPSLNHLNEGPDIIAELEAEVAGLEREAKTVGFVLNPDSEWGQAGLIVLDEVSMVNAKVGQDIESFGAPILVLGDPAQLPPVEGGGYFTDAEPDAMLTEVMRNGDAVLDLATRIRQSTRRDYGLTEADVRPVSFDEAMAADQVLVWKNATRWSLTEGIRLRLGRPKGQPVVGDRVMCLTNNKDLGILNGQQFDVQEVQPAPLGPKLLLAEVDAGKPARWINTYADGFISQQAEADMKRNNRTHQGQRGAFTFANVITVHKAQGSEWGSVYVVDQTAGVVSMAGKDMGRLAAVDMGRRWLYTAVSRAQREVVIARR